MSTKNDIGKRDTEVIESTQIHDILRNERRRRAIECLMEYEGTISVRALAERIAEMETGESPPPCDARKSVYVTLHQNHLSKLEEADLAERVPGGVRKGNNFEEVECFMNEDDGGRIWAKVCAAVSLMGVLTMGVAALGVSVFPRVWMDVLAFSFLVVILFISFYAVSGSRKAPLVR